MNGNRGSRSHPTLDYDFTQMRPPRSNIIFHHRHGDTGGKVGSELCHSLTIGFGFADKRRHGVEIEEIQFLMITFSPWT